MSECEHEYSDVRQVKVDSFIGANSERPWTRNSVDFCRNCEAVIGSNTIEQDVTIDIVGAACYHDAGTYTDTLVFRITGSDYVVDTFEITVCKECNEPVEPEHVIL